MVGARERRPARSNSPLGIRCRGHVSSSTRTDATRTPAASQGSASVTRPRGGGKAPPVAVNRDSIGTSAKRGCEPRSSEDVRAAAARAATKRGPSARSSRRSAQVANSYERRRIRAMEASRSIRSSAARTPLDRFLLGLGVPLSPAVAMGRAGHLLLEEATRLGLVVDPGTRAGPNNAASRSSETRLIEATARSRSSESPRPARLRPRAADGPPTSRFPRRRRRGALLALGDLSTSPGRARREPRTNELREDLASPARGGDREAVSSPPGPACPRSLATGPRSSKKRILEAPQVPLRLCLEALDRGVEPLPVVIL